jgi:Peptidase inhibitor family I36
MKRPLRAVIAMSLVVLSLAFGTPAAAAPQIPWDCPVGDLCVWDGTGGYGRRCNWSGADPDWTTGTVTCSWASASHRIRSMLNRGRSTSFSGVCLYQWEWYGPQGAGIQGWWLAQNGGIADNGEWIFRSHRWETGIYPNVCLV